MRYLDRATSRLPKPWRKLADWLVTIGLAIAFVLAFEAEVAKPYRVPSASMEPTLDCARPAPGCLARFSDRVIANRLAYRFESPRRGQIVVFETPSRVKQLCGSSGTFIKRLIGLPGEGVSERSGYVFVDGLRLREPYVQASERDTQTASWPRIPANHYFFMGDNRRDSCDSRRWGSVPRSNLIGPIFLTYWPPSRAALH